MAEIADVRPARHRNRAVDTSRQDKFGTEFVIGPISVVVVNSAPAQSLLCLDNVHTQFVIGIAHLHQFARSKDAVCNNPVTSSQCSAPKPLQRRM